MSAHLLMQPGGEVVVQEAQSQTAQYGTSKSPRDRESQMREHDPYGVGVTVISMSVVILALAVLNVVFFYLGKVLSSRSGARVRASSKSSKGAVMAAIAMALHEHSTLSRDEEIVNITIEEISRRYSPWNNRTCGIMANRLQRR